LLNHDQDTHYAISRATPMIFIGPPAERELFRYKQAASSKKMRFLRLVSQQHEAALK